ncbi:unnamed protein product [[Candida] boidinii]|nr:unnamed protein product [[Candida] boidinii]
MELAKGAGNSVESQEGAMSCLSKICEDSARLLDVDYNGERPLNFMIPIFIQLMENQNSKIRSSAIFCINQFLLIRTQSILVYLDEYMSRLFTLSTDEDAKVRTNICSAFTNILDARPDKLMPHLDGVINYSIHSVQDNNEDVAVEACEFLLGLATSEIPSDIIKPKLDLIIPVLLTKMVYSEMDVFLMANEDEKDDENVEDKDEDIKPTNAKSKDAHKVTKKTTTQQQQQQSQKQQQSHDSDSDDDDDDDDEDDDDDDDSFDWNLRKCSAATLDNGLFVKLQS